MTCEDRMMATEEKIELLLGVQQRMEAEITEMRRAVVSLARMEERLAGYIGRQDQLSARLDRIDARINEMDDKIEAINRDRWRFAGAVGAVSALAGVVAPSILGKMIGA